MGHRLADVHLAGFAPAFTLSLCDSECSRKPPVPIASVVSGNPCKKNKTNDAQESRQDKKTSDKLPNRWRKKPILTTTSIFNRVNKTTILIEKYNKIMSRLSSKNGFRGEYLARYIVSRFAFISDSSVGEDFGVDFYCGLTKEVNGGVNGNDEFIYYDKPFLLQIKTKTKENYINKYIKPDIEYDTKEKIETLFNLEIPFFIGFLDLTKQKLEIHSTSSMWYMHMLGGVEDIDKIFLRFRPENKTTNIIEKPLKRLNQNNRYEWVVDLGTPILTINLFDLENDIVNIDNIRKNISELIIVEFENVVSKHLGLSYFRWLYEYETNKLETFKFGYKFVGRADDSSFDRTTQNMIDNIQPYLVSLAVTCKDERNKPLYEKIIQLTREISNNIRFENIKTDYNEIYEDIEYDFSANKDLGDHFPKEISGYTYNVNNEIQAPIQTFAPTKPNPIYNPNNKRNKRNNK